MGVRATTKRMVRAPFKMPEKSALLQSLTRARDLCSTVLGCLHEVRQRPDRFGPGARLQPASGIDPKPVPGNPLLGPLDHCFEVLGAGDPPGLNVVHPRSDP